MFRHIIAYVLAAWLLVALLLNGGYMLISPSQWFRLPAWVALRAGLSPNKYSRGFGALQIRFVGAAILTVVIWAILEIRHSD